MRIYITLNEKKDKDKVIIDYLKSTYSESDTIKGILYKYATNGCSSRQLDNVTITDKNRVIDSSDVKRGKEVQINADTDNKVNIDNDILSMFS